MTTIFVSFHSNDPWFGILWQEVATLNVASVGRSEDHPPFFPRKLHLEALFTLRASQYWLFHI